MVVLSSVLFFCSRVVEGSGYIIGPIGVWILSNFCVSETCVSQESIKKW